MKLCEVKSSGKVVYFDAFVKDMAYRQDVLKNVAYSDTNFRDKFQVTVLAQTEGNDVSGTLHYEILGEPVIKNFDTKSGSLELFLTYSLADESRVKFAHLVKTENEKFDSDEDLGHLIRKIENLEFSVLVDITILRVKVFTTH